MADVDLALNTNLQQCETVDSHPAICGTEYRPMAQSHVSLITNHPQPQNPRLAKAIHPSGLASHDSIAHHHQSNILRASFQPPTTRNDHKETIVSLI